MSQFHNINIEIETLLNSSGPKAHLKFGIKFLDDVFGGIYREDLIIVTARTGGGKTELVSQIASCNAALGKQVYFFALEAHKGEIESRILFKALSQAFYEVKDSRYSNETPNYQDWHYGRQDHMFKDLLPEIGEIIKDKYSSLFTYYRDKDFTVETYESHMHRIADQADLIILDHLHYIDFDDHNENKALKSTVKQIRYIQSFYQKPIILVVHLRKMDKRNSDMIPGLEEIHGSSEISKIATKIMSTSPALDQMQAKPTIFPTYFRVLKNRTDGSRCYHIGVCGFDVTQNKYLEYYKVGSLSYGGDKFSLNEGEYPRWANQNLKS